LRAAFAAFLVVLLVPTAALASHGHHGKPKPGLPPVDTSEAANCDFIAEPDNTLCMLPFPDDY
jgi:hypothetical protein